MSSAGSASRRSGAGYASFSEPQRLKEPGGLVDGLLVASGFAMLVMLVVMVTQIA